MKEGDIQEEELAGAYEVVQKVLREMERGLVGQGRIAQRLWMALICGGHVLLEGLPGLAKTTSIRLLGQICHLPFRRIQFTPDLMPADITGTEIFHHQSGEFRIKKGPIFSSLLLADEINRAPSKVQAALLEAMQERQVTISGQCFSLPHPFLVLATQNPIDQEGTYSLPEAQWDRFLFKLHMGYTSLEEEIEIMKRVSRNIWSQVTAVVDAAEIAQLSAVSGRVHVGEQMYRYMASLVFASRFPERYKLSRLKPMIACGASVRGSLSLEQTSKVQAMFEKRAFVTPSDVKEVAYDVLNHRILLTYEAQADQVSKKEIIHEILGAVPVP